MVMDAIISDLVVDVVTAIIIGALSAVATLKHAIAHLKGLPRVRTGT